MLAFADAGAALLVCAALAVSPSSSIDQAFWAAILLPVWLVLAKLNGLYDHDHRALRHLTADELPAVLTWALVGTAAVALVASVTPAGGLAPSAGIEAFVVAGVGAFVLRAFTRFAWRCVTPPERAVIVGSGPLADATRRKLELFPDIHLEVVHERDACTVEELRGAPEWLDGVNRVILASSAIDEAFIAELVSVGRSRHIKVSVIPPARGMFGTAVLLNHVADLPVVEYNTWDAARSTLLLKRTIDVGVALVALPLLAPLFLLVALAVKLDSPGPVFFRQVRAGRAGRPFTMLKFRTMSADAEERLAELVPLEALPEPVFKLRRDPRVTRLGRLLRRTSIDELPQLWNVLRGEMSLVGPRPEQVELVARYEPEHRLLRLAVKPGMTGPMQVFGRGELTFEERLAVEREYVENLSIGRDLRLLALTLPVVSRTHGAY